MEKPKPIKVRNIWSKHIFYGGVRRKPGEVFYISSPEHFSKSGYMVMLDETDGDKEIRHLGGYRKNGGEYISLKGSPVYPGEEVSQPTENEKAEAEAEEKFQAELSRLKADRAAARARVLTPENVNRTAEDIEKETNKEVEEALAPEVTASNQSVI